ncbi:unnamed protein product [Phytomonas sp. Hart1]|nr:unnamed protein product [Phytomonas sp. Hart1]|eukprot:CCW67381.1 unnamed protein product [Phytomonas sp. isolate Hart1]
MGSFSLSPTLTERYPEPVLPIPGNIESPRDNPPFVSRSEHNCVKKANNFEPCIHYCPGLFCTLVRPTDTNYCLLSGPSLAFATDGEHFRCQSRDFSVHLHAHLQTSSGPPG